MIKPGDDLQAEFNALPDMGVLEMAPGNYRVNEPLTLLDKRFTIIAHGATMVWGGKAGACLTVGFSPGRIASGGLGGSRSRIVGLGFYHLNVAEPLMSNPSVALRLQNMYAGRIDGLDAVGFGIGVDLVGDGTGCTYNRIDVCEVLNCRTSVRARAMNGGFVTETVFYGGRWQYGPAANGIDVTHCDFVGPNVAALRFVCSSFEGPPTCQFMAVEKAPFCQWLSCRFETWDGSKAKASADAASKAGLAVTNPVSVGIEWR